MTSIRRHLLVGLLGALLVAGLAAAAGVYLKAQDEANALFDYQLKQLALALRDPAAMAQAVASSGQDDPEQEVLIQIWTNTGLHLYHSHRDSPLLPRSKPGLSTVVTSRGAWRVFSMIGYRRVIQVAQPMRLRQTMAAGIAVRTLLPWLATMPLLGGIIWWLVGRDLTVVHNGKKVLDHVHVDGLTAVANNADEAEPGPFIVQGDHSNVEIKSFVVTPLTR